MRLNLSAKWLTLSVVLTTATQLRFGTLPVGYGEVMLAVWLGISIVTIVIKRGKNFFLGSTAKIIIVFWFLAFVLFTFGSVTDQLLMFNDSEIVWHDLFAFLFVGLFAIVFATQYSHSTYILTLITQLLFFTTVCVLFLLISSLFVRQLGFVNLWYGFRLRAWSDNPNQFALFLVVVPFIAMYMFKHTTILIMRLSYIGTIIVSIVAGFFTGSDALRISWSFSIVFLIIMSWYISITDDTLTYWKSVFLRILLPFSVIVFVLFIGQTLYLFIFEAITEVHEEGNQGENRLLFWKYGIETIMKSPVYGLGPGTRVDMYFLGLSTIKAESHNTFIDWGMCTGILGVIMYVWLLSIIFRKILKLREIFLISAVVAIVVFSIFHYTFRHPLFWFYLVSIASVPESIKNLEK